MDLLQLDQAEGKGKEEGAVFSAGANWVCTGAQSSSAASARRAAPDDTARAAAASASLHEHESSQLPSQDPSQSSSQPELHSLSQS